MEIPKRPPAHTTTLTGTAIITYFEDDNETVSRILIKELGEKEYKIAPKVKWYEFWKINYYR
jgi:hypothetical protein